MHRSLMIGATLLGKCIARDFVAFHDSLCGAMLSKPLQLQSVEGKSSGASGVPKPAHPFVDTSPPRHHFTSSNARRGRARRIPYPPPTFVSIARREGPDSTRDNLVSGCVLSPHAGDWRGS